MPSKPRKTVQSNFIALLNFIADPAIIVDGTGRFLVVNDAFIHLIGLKKKELIGTAFFNISNLTAKSRKTLVENLKKRMNGIAVNPYEIEFTDKIGEKRYAEVKAKKISYNGQSADLVVFHDITRRKENTRRLKEYSEKMEALVNDKIKAVKESEEKFRAISTFASDVIILLDKRDQVIYWNLAAEKIFGFTRNEAIGKKLNVLIVPPKSHKNHLDMIKRLFKNKIQPTEKRTEITALKKDGTKFPIEFSATVISLKGSQYVLEIIRDVSERKKMEETLKQERDMLEAVTENIGAGLTVINEDYRILWANKFLKQINGDCEGKICYSTFNRLGNICPDCGVKKVFENGLPIDMHEYSTKDDKGNTVWVEIIVTPIKDKTGKVIAALELAVNITERKSMQNKLA